MKLRIIHYAAAVIFIVTCCAGTNAQHAINRIAAKENNRYPAAFTIPKSEFDDLFLYRVSEQVVIRAADYLNNAIVLMNANTGGIVSLKLKLAGFNNAILTARVNGLYSTQVFIASADRKIFYKGHFEKNELIMEQCAESETVPD